MTHEEMIVRIKEFSKAKVAVIGDIILDHYLYGNVQRISPEAPIPIVNKVREEYRLGGAANVAAGIIDLTGSANLVGSIGVDVGGAKVRECLDKHFLSMDYICKQESITTIKTRVIGNHQQIVRIDDEEKLDKRYHPEIVRLMELAVSNSDIVIISDYNKGVICSGTIFAIESICKRQGKKLILDCKPQNFKHFSSVFLAVPNTHEVLAFAEFPPDSDIDILPAAQRLSRSLDNANIIVTRSSQGMLIMENEKEPVSVPTKAKEVSDVSGAGDTVIATLALALCSGASILDAATIANYAAGVSVSKAGTSTVSADELIEAILSD